VSTDLLSLINVSKRYGGLWALSGVELAVPRGSIVGLVGPNGAGKTSLFDIVSGLERPETGQIFLQGRDVTDLPAHARAGLGLARTFQTTQTFEALDVVKNVLVGRAGLAWPGVVASGLRTPAVFQQEHADLVRAFEILDLIGLYDKAGRRMNQISTVQRKMVAIGRALAMEPELLLLDEPFGGLSQDEAEQMAGLLESIRGPRTGLLVVDHHIALLGDLADDLQVLVNGVIHAGGRPDRVLQDRAIAELLAVPQASEEPGP